MRQPGHAKILELVVYRMKPEQKGPCQNGIEIERPSEVRIGDLSDAYDQGVLRPATESRSNRPKGVFGEAGLGSDERLEAPTQGEDSTGILARRIADQPPNLTLNVHDALPKSRELWVFAVFGIALQFAAVAVPAVMTYHWRKPKGADLVQDYAYPTFLVGTCLLVMSIALCSFIIEATSVEHVFAPTGDYEVKSVFRLQIQQNMGDQPFKAYIILNHPDDIRIRTSRYDPEEFDQDDTHDLGTSAEGASPNDGQDKLPSGRWGLVQGRIMETLPRFSKHPRKRSLETKSNVQKLKVVVAVALCLTGFVCQFVGLRALHWSATVIQLVVTLLMTCIRAWIRRGISNKPLNFELEPNPNWIALSVGDACEGSWPTEGDTWPKQRLRFLPCESPGSMRNTLSADLITIEDPRIVLRRKIQSLSSNADDDLSLYARNLHRAIRELQHKRDGRSHSPDITWVHVMESSVNESNPYYVRLALTAEDYGWVDEEALHALLAMWRYSKPTQPAEMYVTKVYSKNDYIRKKSFLEAKVDARVLCILLLANGDVAEQYENYDYARMNDKSRRTGLSIENMQDFSEPLGAVKNRLYGYLVVELAKPAADFASEVLAGFMDARWQKMNVRYDYKGRNWYVIADGRAKVLNVDEAVKILLDTGMAANERDAKILVVASLARCTVWKNPPEPDESTPTADQHSDSLPSTDSATQDKSSKREQPRPSTSETAKVGKPSHCSAAAPSNSNHRVTSSPVIPTDNESEAIRVGESSKAGTVTSGASTHEPVSIASTPSLRASQ